MVSINGCRFGEGYTVAIRAESHEHVEAILRFVRESFPEAALRDRHYCSLELLIPAHALPLSRLFAAFESYKSRLHIRDYSVTQTTLDQVTPTFGYNTDF